MFVIAVGSVFCMTLYYPVKSVALYFVSYEFCYLPMLCIGSFIFEFVFFVLSLVKDDFRFITSPECHISMLVFSSLFFSCSVLSLFLFYFGYCCSLCLVFYVLFA